VDSRPEFPAERLKPEQLPDLDELLGRVPDRFEVLRCDDEAIEIEHRPARTITVRLRMDAEALRAVRTVRDHTREREADISTVDAVAQVRDIRGTDEAADSLGLLHDGLELARSAPPGHEGIVNVPMLEALAEIEERFGPPEERGVADTLRAGVETLRALRLLGPEYADVGGGEEALKDLEEIANTTEFMDVTYDSIGVGMVDPVSSADVDLVLGDMSFDEFVRFLFDRPDPGEGDITDDEPWWALGDKATVAKHLIRLFHDPSFLLEDYSVSQIGVGFRRLVYCGDNIPGQCGLLSDASRGLRWGVAADGTEMRRIICGMNRDASIWLASVLARWSGLDMLQQEIEPGLPVSTRQEFFASMHGIFEHLVSKGVDGPWPGWWDEVIMPDDDPDVARTQLETMLRVARLDCETCRDDVRGGLAYFDCPGIQEALEDFLRNSPEIDDVTRRFIEEKLQYLRGDR
jgi:hypothetical protein